MTQINLRKGLVGQWTFDDRHLDTGQDVLKDSSGHGNYADIIGGVSTGITGKVGQAFEFDGDDDELGMPNPDGLGTPEDQSITIHAVFKNDGADSGREGLISNGPATASYGYQTNDSTTEMWFGMRPNDDSGDSDRKIIRMEIESDTWYYVTGVFDTDSRKILAWLNGKHYDTIDYSESSDNLSVSDTWRVGNASPLGGSGSNFAGLISGIGMWKRVLTPTEIQLLHAATGPQVMRV